MCVCIELTPNNSLFLKVKLTWLFNYVDTHMIQYLLKTRYFRHILSVPSSLSMLE